MTLDNRIPLAARRAVRELAGITLRSLAEETSISEDELRAWESGEVRLLYSQTSQVIGELVRQSRTPLDRLLRMYSRSLLTRRHARPARTPRKAKHGTRR